MTVCAILFGLLPIMWSPTTQAGADVMKRIAAPMIGGVVTSAILELLLYPTIYMLWRRRHLANPRGPEAPAASPAPRRGRHFPWLAVLLLSIVGIAGALWWRQKANPLPQAAPSSAGTPFASRTSNGLLVNFYHTGGSLSLSENEVLIEFRDSSSGRPVDVGTVKFALDMNMPGMVMHSGATVAPAGRTGLYRAEIKPEMAGDWTAQLTYDGPHGPGDVSFTVSVGH
jgi:hypothetical protein